MKQGGTLVMSRPELTTRVDRDFKNYTDADLMPPFGFLPPEGKPGEYVEKKFGKGRYFLFTGREFPGATKEGREAYAALVRKLAGEVKQSATISSETEGETDAICYSVYDRHAYFLNMDTRRATISSETEGETDAICYSVYDRHAYFLNMDTRRARTFDYVLDGKPGTMTLEPCEVRIVERGKK